MNTAPPSPLTHAPAPYRAAPRHVRRRALTLAVFVMGFGAFLLWDKPALAWMRAVGFPALKLRFEPALWWRALWFYGTLYPWALVSLALVLRALLIASANKQRAIFLALVPLLAAALAGGLADGLKPFLCRMRPEHAVAPATYKFVHFASNFPNGSGLGLPSSHAAVAVGGALALLSLFWKRGKRARSPALEATLILALLLALGTCLSRVLVGAHYPSDTYLGAWTGYASVQVMHWLRAKGEPKPFSPPP